MGSYKQTQDNHDLLKPLMILATLCLVVGIIITAIAVNLAIKADQFADPRYATYWMGISAIVVFLLYLFIHWNVRKQRGMAMFAFVVFTIIVCIGTICCIIAMANLGARAHKTKGVKHNNCLYINKERQYTGPGTGCREQCNRAMKRTERVANPPETCCCCLDPDKVTTSPVVADRKVDSCDGMTAVALDSIIALSVFNGVTAILYCLMTILCLVVLFGTCGQKKLFEKSKGDE